MFIKTYPALEAIQHLEEVRGKFVQISWWGERWLLFASKDQHAFHNQILAHFLSDNHVAYHWKSPEVLEFDKPELKIHGGGRFLLDWDGKALKLFGDSMVYGRFEESMLDESWRQVGGPWAELTLSIE